MNSINKTIPFILFLLFGTLSTYDQPFWKQLKKPGGVLMFSFTCASKDSLFASTSSGVYLSTNDGESWQRYGLKNLSTGTIYRHPNGTLFVYAYSDTGNRIYRKRTTDADWEPLSFVFDEYISFITHTDRGLLFACSTQTMYKSEDFGNSWHAVAGICGNVSSLVELSDGELVASVKGTGNESENGIYRLQDDGETWQQIGLAGISITTLVKNSREILYAGCNTHKDLIAGHNGIYISEDKGETWEKINNLHYVYNMVLDAKDDFYMNEWVYSVIEGVYCNWKSFDEGYTWIMNNTGMTYPSEQELLMSPDGYLYSYGTTLLNRSVNPLATGIENIQTHRLTVYPNPCFDELHIEGISSHPAMISLTDLIGKKVYTGNYRGDAVNLSHLPPGVYILHLKAGGKEFVQKIVKQ